MDQMLYRASDLCKLLSLSRSKIYALMSEGSLRTIKIGTSVRVRNDDLQSWLEKQRTTGGDNP